jgi:hypothetical protein
VFLEAKGARAGALAAVLVAGGFLALVLLGAAATAEVRGVFFAAGMDLATYKKFYK